jgi:hypothetical protein
MIASLHLETTDLGRVKSLLEPRLMPDSSAFLRLENGWVRVYFNGYLDDGDAEDFESVARELSKFATTVTCFGEAAPATVKCFQNDFEVVNQVKLERPDLSFDDIETGDAAGFERLEFEAGKPGLAEFFGRSQDE